MKIAIIGGGGMLGHQLWLHLRPKWEVWVSIRKRIADYRQFGLFQDGKAFECVDARDFSKVEHMLNECNPDVVLNCIGVIKQLKEAKSPVETISLNALLPHLLADWCSSRGAKLIHFSTDCVFSGKKGCYSESDIPDAEDLYGRTKLLGEPTSGSSLTLRTSIIGPEIDSRVSLLEWFISQRGRYVKGYRRAVFSGLTTFEVGRVVDCILNTNLSLKGIWHLSSAPITKYDLLSMVNELLALEVSLQPDDALCCDRSLCSQRFQDVTGYRPPTWEAMIRELAMFYTNQKHQKQIYADSK